MEKVNDLSPIVKWAGGKEQELKYILPNVPDSFVRFIEPFVGGGAVYFSMKNKNMLINDKSVELTSLYNNIKYKNESFVSNLQALQNAWVSLENILDNNIEFFNTVYLKYKLNKIDKDKLIVNIERFINNNKTKFKSLLNSNLLEHYDIFEKELLRNISAKLIRMKDLEDKKGNLPAKDIYDNFECGLKGSFYMFIRTLYNKYDNSEYFYFIREYCYSSMFRYNSNGEFNVPYGGISYNRKNFQRKIDYIKSKELQTHFVNTDIYNLDFEEFLDKIKLTKNDFIFLDPPYDTDFSSYVNNTFDKQDQERLADYLINKCPAKFMLVIKNTDFILNLYDKKGLYITSFDKTYMVSFKGRNNRDCEHLLITNYPINNEIKKSGTVTALKPNKKKQLQYA
ncbi:DNA adenine methylase [bacterium]|nr:DNA adenine methylase [bacterium]